MQETVVPFSDPDVAVIITNSNVKRSLAQSAYVERLEQCRSAASALGKSSLRDASENDVECKNSLTDIIQGDSVARGPKLLSIKNYVIEIIT